MGFYRSLGGMVDVELTGADPGASLQKLAEHGISMYDVRSAGELTVFFSIRRLDYPTALAIARLCGDTIRKKKQRGVFWVIRAVFQRPVLIIGLLALFLTAMFLPGRILIVEVEGNSRIPDRQILEAAHESGIGLFASGREVRSEKMKNALLSKLPQLQWAGVNTYGSRAVITVRERNQELDADSSSGVCSIVADRDGVILTCTATRGSALCIPGQAVRKGDVLISGYTDCGLTIEATQAQGEILALTNRTLTVKTAASENRRGVQTGKNVNYYIQFGKKRINFFKGSGISEGSCVKMYSEYVLTLPGGYRLPVSFIRETVIHFDLETVKTEEREARTALSDFSSRYLTDRMIAGAIIEKSEHFSLSDGAFCLSGYYECQEMIGRMRPERIGEYHGKTD